MIILLHIISALLVLILGIFLFGKRNKYSNFLGQLRLITMFLVAMSGFFIKTSGNFSPLHLFSIITIISLLSALRAKSQKDFITYNKRVVGPFIGLLIALPFTFLPDRYLGAKFLSYLYYSELTLNIFISVLLLSCVIFSILLIKKFWIDIRVK